MASPTVIKIPPGAKVVITHNEIIFVPDEMKIIDLTKEQDREQAEVPPAQKRKAPVENKQPEAPPPKRVHVPPKKDEDSFVVSDESDEGGDTDSLFDDEEEAVALTALKKKLNPTRIPGVPYTSLDAMKLAIEKRQLPYCNKALEIVTSRFNPPAALVNMLKKKFTDDKGVPVEYAIEFGDADGRVARGMRARMALDVLHNGTKSHVTRAGYTLGESAFSYQLNSGHAFGALYFNLDAHDPFKTIEYLEEDDCKEYFKRFGKLSPEKHLIFHVWIAPDTYTKT